MINYIKQQVAWWQFYFNESVRLCSITVHHCTLRETLAYLWRENVAFIEPDMCPNNPDLNRKYYIWGHARASLPRQEVWHRWLAEAGDRAGVSHATDRGASLIGLWKRRLYSVSWIKTEDRLNIRFTNSLYCKIIVVIQTLCSNIFCSVTALPTALLSLQIISLDKPCWYTRRPLAS